MEYLGFGEVLLLDSFSSVSRTYLDYVPTAQVENFFGEKVDAVDVKSDFGSKVDQKL